MYNKIKDYYKKGLWSLERVRNVVGKAITEEQFKEITGEDYTE